MHAKAQGRDRERPQGWCKAFLLLADLSSFFFASHTSLKKPMLVDERESSSCAHKKLQDKNFCRIFTIAAMKQIYPFHRWAGAILKALAPNENNSGYKQICAIGTYHQANIKT